MKVPILSFTNWYRPVFSSCRPTRRYLSQSSRSTSCFFFPITTLILEESTSETVARVPLTQRGLYSSESVSGRSFFSIMTWAPSRRERASGAG